MAFDLRIRNGDLLFDEQGRIELVRNSNKLTQEILKFVTTTRGSDPYNPDYGLTITEASIGSVVSTLGLETSVEAEITTGLERLQAEQQVLQTQQRLTPSELLQQIDRVSVEQDTTDPRQFNIFISVTTQALTPITIDTAIRARG